MTMNNQAGKGSKRRPCLTSRAEEKLRWDLKEGKITFKEFERRMKSVKKVRRSA